MKNWTIGQKLSFAVVISYLLIATVGGVLFFKTEQFLENEKWVSHTNSVRAKLRESVLALVNMETGLRGYAVGGDEKFLEPYEEGRVQFQAALDELLVMVSDNPVQVERLKELSRVRDQWISSDVADTLRKRRQVDAGEIDEATFNAFFNLGRGKALMDQMRGLIDTCIKAEADLLAIRSDLFVRAATASHFWILIGLPLAIAIGMTLTGLIVRQTKRLLTRVAETLSDASAQVAAAAGQVASSSQILANGSSQQAASLEETSASLEEIGSMTRQNAENAVRAKTASQSTREMTEEGSREMDEMVAAMNSIKASSDNIAHIIKTIDEIAFQTNILALNAAVEAARAGEAGAGFAVVADEVRALAQRAAQAARETSEKIDDSIQKSGRGVEISDRVAKALSSISTKTQEVNDLVVEITNASQEQRDGLSQIGTAVAQMDTVTQSNASTAEEVASSSEELHAQSNRLLHSVSELRTLVGGSSTSSRKESTDTPVTHSFSRSPSPPMRKPETFAPAAKQRELASRF